MKGKTLFQDLLTSVEEETGGRNKMSKNHMVFSLISIFGVMVTSMFGCSSTELKLRKANKLDIQNQDPSTSVSDDNATEKKDPKMTSLEHERSGDLQLRRGNFDMAYIQYEKSLRLKPDNVKARYKKGLLLVIARMNVDAIKEFQEVLKREPEHALAYEGLGKAYFQMKKYDPAERNFRRSLALYPNLWQPHNFLGIIYDHQGRHDLAIHEFEAAIRLKPNEGLLYNNLGVSYSLAGEYKKALNAFNRAQKRNYFSSKFYNNLGLVLSKLGRDQEALNVFRRVGGQAQAYNNLGCIYLEAGEFEKAINYFEKAIEVKPTFYAKASDNLEKAKISRSRESSIESNVKILPNSQAEQPAVNLEEKRQQQEEASSKPQMVLSMEVPANPERESREKNLQVSVQKPVHVEGLKTDSLKTVSISQEAHTYALIESPTVEHLVEGKGFRLKFKLVNPGRKKSIAGTIAIVASLKHFEMPQFISFPRMELDEDGLSLGLKKGLKFTRILNFKHVSGGFDFPFSHAQAFRVLVYNPRDQLVYTHVVHPEKVEVSKASSTSDKIERQKIESVKIGEESFKAQIKSTAQAGLNLEQSVRGENSHIQGATNTHAEKTFIEHSAVGQKADRKEKDIASEKRTNVPVSLSAVQTEENIGKEEKESLKPIAVKEEQKPVFAQAIAMHSSLQTEEDRIVSLVESWRMAWESKTLDEYIAHYHPAFEKDGKDLNAWKHYKKKLNKRYRHISVKISKLKVIIERDKDTAWAYFIQRYRSETFRFEGYKLVEFRKEGDSWKIFRERSFEKKPGK
jgi:Flp pilus assembly protein TadD/ketosteroid isomerase-like protein